LIVDAVSAVAELTFAPPRRAAEGIFTMSTELPVIYLARHGETAWSLTGQHTGLTDLPLTQRGEQNARSLGQRLNGLSFVKVFTSPLQRARRTCELAGFGAAAEVDRDLLEWDYGSYEGRTSVDLHAERPDWAAVPRRLSWRGNARRGRGPGRSRGLPRPGGTRGRAGVLERAFPARARCAMARARAWGGGHYLLSTASLSVLGYEHARSTPVIKLWNDTHHVGA
jgi:broad specificity phosphatase PhoE